MARFRWLADTAEQPKTAAPPRWAVAALITPPPSLVRPLALMKSGYGLTWTAFLPPIHASVLTQPRSLKSALLKLLNSRITAPKSFIHAQPIRQWTQAAPSGSRILSTPVLPEPRSPVKPSLSILR